MLYQVSDGLKILGVYSRHPVQCPKQREYRVGTFVFLELLNKNAYQYCVALLEFAFYHVSI